MEEVPCPPPRHQLSLYRTPVNSVAPAQASEAHPIDDAIVDPLVAKAVTTNDKPRTFGQCSVETVVKLKKEVVQVAQHLVECSGEKQCAIQLLMHPPVVVFDVGQWRVGADAYVFFACSPSCTSRGFEQRVNFSADFFTHSD